MVYGLNYLDKTTLSYASIMGIKKDIHLVGDNYQWLGFVLLLCFQAELVRGKGTNVDSGQCSTLAILGGSISQTACCKGCRLGSILLSILFAGERFSRSMLRCGILDRLLLLGFSW